MIKLLLFAHLQEEVGVSELEINQEHITVMQLKQWIQTEYNVSHIDQVMTAINEEFATNEDEIVTGDVVAFIPPVSGG